MFRVDDRFASSDPVIRIPRDRRLAAIGLWTLAGTWSAQFLKDGWVPDHIVADYDAAELAADLVAVKLWKRRAGGYQFVDWARWQHTREQREKYREGERDRKRRQRARPAESSGDVPGDVPPGHHPESTYPSPVQSKDLTDGNKSAPSRSAGAAVVTDPINKRTLESAARYGLTSLPAIVDSIRTHTHREVDQTGAYRVAVDILDRKKGAPPRAPQRYVTGSVSRSWAEVQRFIDDQALAVPQGVDNSGEGS